MVPTDILVPADGIRWRSALDELVLLEVSTGRSWLLDPAATAIWEAVVIAGSAQGALALLPGADPREVEGFLDGLVEAGPLVRSSGG